MTNLRSSEASNLEQFRVALDNAVNQPLIASLMTEFGYGVAVIDQGKTIWETAYDAYLSNETEDDETKEAYDNFKILKMHVLSTYKLYRRKAKAVYKRDTLTLERLGIKGSFSSTYVVWLQTVDKFYTVALADETIQSRLAILKITAETLSASQAQVAELKAARTTCILEKGESQDATKIKDEAMKELDYWMSDFYAVAAIALEDHPQLLEALGKVIRS